jgi:thymidine kinase
MTGKLVVITGPMFSGKCLKCGTKVLMYDGSLKNIEDIRVGEQVMGDDSSPRKVLGVVSGYGPLYEIQPKIGVSYVVNEDHILTLMKDNVPVDISIKEYLRVENKSEYHGYHREVMFPHREIAMDPYLMGQWLGTTSLYPILNPAYIINTREIRLGVLMGLLDSVGQYDAERDVWELSVANVDLAIYVFHLISTLGLIASIDAFDRKVIRLFGYDRPFATVPIDVYPEGNGDYAGFTLDGNGRFLLGDCTVTHNSTELQRQVRRINLSKKKCIVIKHAIDTRYGKKDQCCTHDLNTMSAVPTHCLWDVKEQCLEYDVVAVDEAQFYPEIVEFVDDMVENHGKTVIVAALDGTYEGKPFGRIHELVARSEQFIKLTAVCCDCGDDASFTVRRSDYVAKDGPVEVVVGSSDIYDSVCRECRQKRRKYKTT